MVGAKAANLSRLAASHAVPPGFCLPAAAFEHGVAADPGTGRTLASGLSLPSALYDLLADAYRGLANLCQTPEVSVAVRSSALDEDASAAPCARQHAT